MAFLRGKRDSIFLLLVFVFYFFERLLIFVGNNILHRNIVLVITNVSHTLRRLI